MAHVTQNGSRQHCKNFMTHDVLSSSRFRMPCLKVKISYGKNSKKSEENAGSQNT